MNAPTQETDEVIARMYKALMTISFVVWRSKKGKKLFGKVQEIANECIREMNAEHAALVSKALGLEKQNVTIR